MKLSNLTDLPITSNEFDKLGIDYYKDGLKMFIESAQTPLTIAIQGEWGSGKTSLLNFLRHELCGGDNSSSSEYYGIWINTWEYGLMMDASSTLINVITGIIDEVIYEIEKTDETSVDELKRKAKSFITKVGKAAIKTSANVTIGSGTGEVIDSLFEMQKRETTVRQLREELQKTINEFIEKNPQKGFIFFIDDLDRINPPVAVQILELLKNIFDLENCIFLLAIDYEVVVKGLEPKFGKKSMENEREFRSFFEKIIQLPFSMPINNYEVKEFIINKLDELQLMSDETIRSESDTIEEISLLTVGKNPRAIKRLMNSLSLLNCVSRKNTVKTEESDIIRFFLLSLQISYPQVYSVLSKYPDFTSWDNEIIIDYQLTDVLAESEDILSSEFFGDDDEGEWKRILFSICQKDYFLKSNYSNLVRLFELIESYILGKSLQIEQVITNGLKVSSVTSVDSNIVHTGKKINLDKYEINLKEIDPIYRELHRTATQLIFSSEKTEQVRERYGFDKFVFSGGAYKRTKEDAVRLYLSVDAFENPEMRVRFMHHLENYGFKMTDRMKSIDARCSTLYSDKLPLKDVNDEVEVNAKIKQLLQGSADSVKRLEQAVLDFDWDQ